MKTAQREKLNLELDSALTNVKSAQRLIDGCFEEETEDVDLDNDLTEAIDRCNSAIEYLYEAKKAVNA